MPYQCNELIVYDGLASPVERTASLVVVTDRYRALGACRFCLHLPTCSCGDTIHMVLLMASGQGAPVRLVHLPAPVLCNWLRFYFLVEHWNLEVCIYFLTQASFIRRPRATISTEPHFHSCVRADRHCPALRHGTSGRAFCAWAASLIPGMFSTQSVPMHDLMAIARCPVWCSSQQSVRA